VNDFDRAAGNERLGRIAELLERSGIPLDEIARVDKVRIGEYQTAIKLRREDGTDELRTVTAAAEKHKVAISSVRRALRAAGVPPLPRGRRQSDSSL
jgi:hypothetical protein